MAGPRTSLGGMVFVLASSLACLYVAGRYYDLIGVWLRISCHYWVCNSLKWKEHLWIVLSLFMQALEHNSRTALLGKDLRGAVPVNKPPAMPHTITDCGDCCSKVRCSLRDSHGDCLAGGTLVCSLLPTATQTWQMQT